MSSEDANLSAISHNSRLDVSRPYPASYNYPYPASYNCSCTASYNCLYPAFLRCNLLVLEIVLETCAARRTKKGRVRRLLPVQDTSPFRSYSYYLIKNPGSGIRDQRSRIKDQRSKIPNRESAISDYEAASALTTGFPSFPANWMISRGHLDAHLPQPVHLL